MGRLHKFCKLQANFLSSIDPKKCKSCHILFVLSLKSLKPLIFATTSTLKATNIKNIFNEIELYVSS